MPEYALRKPIVIEEYGIKIIGYGYRKTEDGWLDWIDIIKIKDGSIERHEIRRLGFETRYLTPEEHELIGSTVDERYWRPNVPLAVQDGEDVQTCNEKRKEMLAIFVLGPRFGKNIYFKDGRIEVYPVLVTLEPLDEEGRTVRKPRPINLEALK